METLQIETDLQESELASPSVVRARRWLFLLLLILPMAILIGKLPMLPTSAFFTKWFSLADAPKHMRTHVEYVIFVPLSALVVSFFRLTLGLPVLSLFRPILVAIAFRAMGIPAGLAFLALVVGVVLLIRPLLRGAHYYSRVPIQLSIVAMFLLVPLILVRLWPEDFLHHLAYFPMISLCLICEAFTKKLDEKGLARAAWPTINTILIGMLIGEVARIPGTFHLLLRFPEFLVAQTGIVLLIGEYLHFELLKDKNPFVRKEETAVAVAGEEISGSPPLLVETQQVGDAPL